jgi:sugar O-acyltransferase (sialic acid O-acetyltransferase NeuD family)
MADSQSSALNPKPLPAPFLGNSQQALAAHPDAQCIIAVGDAQARRSIAVRLLLQHPGLRFATLVHPRAWVANGVRVGQGSVVFAGALINVDATLGAHNSINLACTISHDCMLGDYASLGPGVHMAGAVTLGDAVDVGTGACFRPRVSVGANAVIGAGAAVVCDLPGNSTAVGVPARPWSGPTERGQ